MFLLLIAIFLLPARAVPEQGTPRPLVEPRGLELRILELVNRERVKERLKPLKIDRALSEIARRHSEDMDRRRFFDHVNPDGQGPTERGVAARYKCVKYLAGFTSSDSDGNVIRGDYIAEGLAENLFQNNLYNRVIISSSGTTYEWNTADKIARTSVEGWMASQGHRENILNKRYQKTGVGIVIAANDQVLITQVFC